MLKVLALVLVCALPEATASASSAHSNLAKESTPSEFVSISERDSSFVLDIRYAGPDNFMGRPVKGYLAKKCLLTKAAVAALIALQKEIQEYGFVLKVFDCYRPQEAVDDFVAWAKDLRDLKKKKKYYPNVDKANLFRDGYIAEKSGHSRGSTVDLTLIDLKTKRELDMGSAWDFFDVKSHTSHFKITSEQRRNRFLLKILMERHGFKNLPEEWWHYTLKAEPFPNQYFSFAVQ